MNFLIFFLVILVELIHSFIYIFMQFIAFNGVILWLFQFLFTMFFFNLLENHFYSFNKYFKKL